MPDLLISAELRDAVRELILRGRFLDDPASNVLGAVVQLNGLAAAEAPVITAAEKAKRRRPRRGLVAVPSSSATPSVAADLGSSG